MSTLIGENTRITLHFSLALADGGVVDSTFDQAPAEFEYGDGRLPDGFLSFLTGLEAGASEQWEVPPEKAFGMPNPNNIQTFKRQDFAADMALTEGLVIAFADASQSELPGVVKTFDEQVVTVDFNHPLAGEMLTFRVEILDVQPL